MTQRLPEFIVAGVRKCGTTWLDQCLREHPQIYLPEATKETFYFDRYYARGVDWYANYFAAAHDGQLCGEVGPSYFTEPEAPERILATNARTKIVLVFREPVARVVSLYNHMRAKGDTALELSEAVDGLPELLEEGFYARYARHFVEMFGRARVELFLSEELQANLPRLFTFLGVDPAFRPALLGERSYERREARSHALAKVASGASRMLHAMGLHEAVKLAKRMGAEKVVLRAPEGDAEAIDPAIAERLYALYHDDITRLGELMERDLSKIWTAERAGAGARE